MQSLLSVIRDSNIPPEQMRDRLREVADKYAALRSRLEYLSRDSNDQYMAALTEAVRNGDLSAAQSIITTMTAKETEQFGSDSIVLADSYEQQGELAYLHGHFDEARLRYERAYQIFQKYLPTDDKKLQEIQAKIQQSVKEAK
jgi:hypothetical protein